MIVKCCKPFSLREYFERLGTPMTVCDESAPGDQLTVGEIYLVIEVIIGSSAEQVSYRIVDNQGFPAIYESYCFEIVSGSLDGLSIEEITEGKNLTITHKLVADSKLRTDYGGRFWEVYFDSEDKEKEKESRNLLKNVIKDLSLREKIPAPVLEWDR